VRIQKFSKNKVLQQVIEEPVDLEEHLVFSIEKQFKDKDLQEDRD
jgi:hypothetical protein